MAQSSSRWSVIVAFALVSAASQVLWLNFAGVTTVAARHYAVSESAIGWLAQVFPLIYVVLAIPAGLVLDRWFRGGLAAGAVLTALGALVRLVGDDFGWILAGQILVSIAQPLVLNAITGITARYLAPRDRAAGIAVGAGSTFSGMIVAFALTAVFSAEPQLSTLLWVTAVFSVLGAIALLVLLRRPPQEQVVSGQRSSGLSALKIALADPFIRRLCPFAFVPFGTFVALTTFAQPLLAPSGVSGNTSSLILLANVAAGVLGCAVLPVWVAKKRAQTAALVTSVVVTAVGCVLLAIVPGPVVGFVVLALIGLMLLPALPISLELLERRTGEAEGTAAGLVWMAGNLGGLVVAFVTGLLVDQSSLAFLLLAAVTLLGLPMILLFRSFIGAAAEAS